MKEQVEKVSSAELTKRGFTRCGWVNDETIMSEIRRDYLAKGYIVAFHKMDACKIAYWHRPATADELDTIKQFSQMAQEFQPTIL